ncbi:homoserine kinase [Apostasia shenzhenica]|uniref:Homoserine kinase n=1 Tax=Apostasia shenzhenica TaxID=1088818 RepID=A0A2I0A574_9ASPA|nr:homoserine kinase [Apostasia shenzhenica]
MAAPAASASISTAPQLLSCKKPSFPRFSTVRCSSLSHKTLADAKSAITDPAPVFRTVESFAPATVANLGPGFDFLGCAVDGLGDIVTVSVDPSVPPGSLSISSISGDHPAAVSKLKRNPNMNCAGIAGAAVMRMLGVRSVGLSLRLHKGLPLGSGLGSSAASAAAAAVAVNALFGGVLSAADLVLAGLESEKKFSGYHADNVAPSLMGGFVLIRSYEPLDLIRLEFPSNRDLFFVLVSPEFEAPTKKMRAVLPEIVRREEHVANASQAAALVAAVIQGDVRVLGSALSADLIVEPKRAPLIPGMVAVKKAALEAGAFGCTISGSGPTAVAVTEDEEKGMQIGKKMVEAFMAEGRLTASAVAAKLDRVGARVISSTTSD